MYPYSVKTPPEHFKNVLVKCFFFRFKSHLCLVGFVEFVDEVMMSGFVAVLGNAAVLDMEDLATRTLTRGIS